LGFEVKAELARLLWFQCAWILEGQVVDWKKTGTFDDLIFFIKIVGGDFQQSNNLLAVVEHSSEDTGAHTPLVLAKSHAHIQQFNLLLDLKSFLVLIELKSKQDRKDQDSDQQDLGPRNCASSPA
jgi:hypothetical protein